MCRRELGKLSTWDILTPILAFYYVSKDENRGLELACNTYLCLAHAHPSPTNSPMGYFNSELNNRAKFIFVLNASDACCEGLRYGPVLPLQPSYSGRASKLMPVQQSPFSNIVKDLQIVQAHEELM